MSSLPILKLVAKADQDLIVARYRMRQIADLASLTDLERTRLMTALSEVLRDALKEAGEARIEFNVRNDNRKQFIEVIVSYRVRAGNSDPQKLGSGVEASRKLIDEFHLQADAQGAKVTLMKAVGDKVQITPSTVEGWIGQLKKHSPFSVVEDLEQQNKQLIDTLEELEKYRTKLEEKTTQLHQANQYKGEFLANMSHEIRTPMNAVIGMSNILDRTELTGDQRKYLHLIKEAGTSLLDIINDILDFSKIEAGKLVIESIRFDLFDLAETCVELLSSNAHTKGLALVCWIDPQIPAFVEGDRTRLRQILINLLSNAIKFTESGEVVVRVRQLESATDEVLLRFEVIDSGIGLSEEQRLKLFQPFIQADGSTTRKYGGTGLGLSICKQLVELMRGRIGVDSVQGSGSTFWFELPYTVAPAEPDQAEVPDVMPDFKNALVVDDHLPMREVAHFCLDAWNIPNKSAQSAMEALRMVETEDFDLFIIDYLMPQIDGLELTVRLREQSRFKNSRIILLTALQDEQLGERAIATGCDAFLTKPLRQSHLLDCLRMLSSDKSATFKTGSFRRTPKTPAEVELTTAASPHQAQRVLLVEDNPTNQIVAGIELRGLGLDVTTAGNGEEALQHLAKSAFEMIFMDCQMPVMDGYEATQTIRKNEMTTGKHIPIVAMTANALEGDREKCLASGMDDYVTKPFNPEDLKSVVSKWLIPVVAVTSNQAEPVAPKEESGAALDFERLTSRYTAAQSQQLLSVFLADTGSKLLQFESLIVQGDLDGISKLAHGIKGAASMIFADGLAEAAKELELTAKKGDAAANYPEMYKTAQDQFSRLSDAVQKLLTPAG